MADQTTSVARPPIGIGALCLTVVAVLWAALFFDIDRSQKQTLKQASNDAANLAMAFRENVQRTVGAIDQLMLAIIVENRESGDEYDIPSWVKKSPLLKGLSLQVSIAGADGIVIDSTLPIRGQVNISDRPHFRYHFDLSAPEPYISVPVIGRNSGKWSIQVTRRFTHNDGSFGGIIVVSVDPFYFSQFFDNVQLGQHGVMDLIGRDGIVRARRALTSQQIGQSVGDTALFKQMQSSSAGSAIIRSRLDGVERVFGYSTVPDYPLIVAVGIALDDVLAPVRSQRTLYIAVGSVLTLIILGLGWFFAGEAQRRRRHELDLAAEIKTREQKALLDTALNNMRHGLVLFDKDGRALVVNQRYIEMYRLPADAIKPGCMVRELVEMRKTSGTFDGDVDAYIETQFVRDRVTDGVFDLPDGRLIHIKNRFMDDGGWVSTHEDVTERMKAQRTLETTLATMDQGLMVIDAAGRIVVCNRRVIELMELPPTFADSGPLFADALKYWWENNDGKRFCDDFETFISARSALDRPLCYEFSQRNGRILECRNAPLSGGGAVRTYTDITERKTAEMALATAEREASNAHTRLRDAFEVVPEGLALLDADDRYVMWNRRYAELYGLTADVIRVGARFEDVLRAGLAAGQYPEARGREQEWLAERLALHMQDNAHHEQQLPGNRWLRIRERRTADGGSVGVRIDITELRHREESVRMLFELNPVPMFVMDCDDFRFLAVNELAVRHYGYSREQFATMTKLDLHLPEERQRYVELFNAFRESGSSEFDSTAMRRHRKADGSEILVHVYGRRLQYHGRPALLCSIVDFTERKIMEDQLKQAQKMEAVGNLTGGVAHDFNNLLTVIMGNLDLLQEELAGNASVEEKIGLMEEAVERGADLTRSMLAFARRQPLQAKEININDLLATTIRMLSRILGENISVNVKTAGTPLVAFVDPTQLQTALLNIAINARDAMPDGGTLTISTRVTELDEAYAARHSGVTPGSYIAVEIADSGTGMPPEVLERIFEPFFTTKSGGRGTGLGLSMVYGFVKQSGGHIRAYSEIGHGSVFKLFLPFAKSASQARDVDSIKPRTARQAGNEVILAVEDNPGIRASVVCQLRDLGYKVHEAANADAALQILDGAEPIDLLFTDMIMPGGFNGKELAIKARAKRADLKVLFTSGFPGQSTTHGAQLEPGDVLLSKPYHKRDLARAVEQVLTASI